MGLFMNYITGLAKAFNDTLHRHPTIANVIRTYFGIEDSSSPAYKLAEVIKDRDY